MAAEGLQQGCGREAGLSTGISARVLDPPEACRGRVGVETAGAFLRTVRGCLAQGCSSWRW